AEVVDHALGRSRPRVPALRITLGQHQQVHALLTLPVTLETTSRPFLGGTAGDRRGVAPRCDPRLATPEESLGAPSSARARPAGALAPRPNGVGVPAGGPRRPTTTDSSAPYGRLAQWAAHPTRSGRAASGSRPRRLSLAGASPTAARSLPSGT